MPSQTPAELSRADLLRVLHRASDVPAASLARLLGWDCEEAAEPGAEDRARRPAARAGAAGASAPPRYLSRPAPVYWHLIGCEPLAGDPAPDRQDDPTQGELEAEAEAHRLPAPDPRMPPLLGPGQWQNLWDRLPPSPRRGRALDLAGCLRRLARAEPLRDLPRRPRRGFNRAVTLLLDRRAALRPVWEDMRLGKRSLEALLGDELQAFLLPAGPEGPWLESKASPPPAGGHPAADPEPGPDSITEDALVVLIGAFGALDTAEIGADWRRLLGRLHAAGHPILLVSVCPLRQSALPAAPMDPAIDRADRDAADEALRTLLAGLSQTWLPTPARLRRLRRAIPGADLHTELRAYNAADVDRDAFHLWLDPDRLWVRLNDFAELPEARRAPLRAVIEDWRRRLDAGARAIEHLQASLLAPGPPGRYPQIARQAAAVAAALDGPSTPELAARVARCGPFGAGDWPRHRRRSRHGR